MRARLLLCAPIVLACAPQESHPPEYQNPDGQPVPRTCADVRAGEVTQGNVIWVDGAPAGCGAVGQQCPLVDLPAFAQVCETGEPYGECQTVGWVVRCHVDAGSTDAASD